MDTFLRDIRYAIRTLIHLRGVGAVAILTLAVGIGAATTMFSVVYAALLRPPPFSKPDRLVIIYNTRATARDGLQRLRWSQPHFVRLRQSVSSFESMASFTSTSVALSGGGDPEQIDGEVVGDAATLRQRCGAVEAGRDARSGECGALAIGGRFADQGSPTTTAWSATAVPVGTARVDATVRRSALLLFAAAACVLVADAALMVIGWFRAEAVVAMPVRTSATTKHLSVMIGKYTVRQWTETQPRRHEDTKKKTQFFFVPSCFRGCIWIAQGI